MIIGIDPGVTGAIAVLRSVREQQLKGGIEAELTLYDMPLFTVGTKQQTNPYVLSNILNEFRRSTANVTVYLEQVSAMPGQGVSSMFNFGVSFGIIQGVLAGLGLPVVMVTPGAWKKRAKLIGKAKDEARTLAQRLYPAVNLSRKKDVGRADAILIARFGPTGSGL